MRSCVAIVLKFVLCLGYFCSSNQVQCLSLAAKKTKTATAIDAVQVYDNVISPEVCELLHEYASTLGLGHSLFEYGKYNKDNPIEKVLDSILHEIDDDNNKENDNDIVNLNYHAEYWTRQYWKGLEVHSDIDEHAVKELAKHGLLSDSKQFRYPDYGHVLYLQVGSKVRGPTCIFPNRSTADQLLQQSSLSKGDGKVDDEHNAIGSSDTNDDSVELITCPAVQGRLLRFPGSWLHSVPRPHDQWFLNILQGHTVTDPESEWGRSVILFNTWIDQSPPQYVSTSSSAASSSSSTSSSSCLTTNDDEKSIKLIQCNSKNHWKIAEINDNISGEEEEDDDVDEDSPAIAKMKLLGDRIRRGVLDRYVKLHAPSKKEIVSALKQSTKVSRVYLEQLKS